MSAKHALPGVLPGALLHCGVTQGDKMQLEKGKADLQFELQRAQTARERAEAAAKATSTIAESKLEAVLQELNDAKHSTEAASTTSEFVLKVSGAGQGGTRGMQLHC